MILQSLFSQPGLDPIQETGPSVMRGSRGLIKEHARSHQRRGKKGTMSPKNRLTPDNQYSLPVVMSLI